MNIVQPRRFLTSFSDRIPRVTPLLSQQLDFSPVLVVEARVELGFYLKLLSALVSSSYLLIIIVILMASVINDVSDKSCVK